MWGKAVPESGCEKLKALASIVMRRKGGMVSRPDNERREREGEP